MILLDEKENKKKRKCDACSMINEQNYELKMGHSFSHMSCLHICEACLHDLKDVINHIISKKISSSKR